MNRAATRRDRSAAMSSRERNILIVTSIAHYLTHLYMLIFPSLALSLRPAFGLPLDEVLAISFWMYLLYGLMALPAGVITDLTRPRLMLIVCLLGMGGCAAVASVADSAVQLRWALAGLGLFAAIYHPSGMALISTGVRRRGWALGLNGLFGNLGVVSAPFLAGILAVSFGWRRTYLILAIPGLLAGLLACLLRFESRIERTAPLPASRNSVHRALTFGLLCIAMMLGGIVYRGQTLVLPAYFEQKIHFLAAALTRLPWTGTAGGDAVAATTLTSLAYLAGAWGQACGGRLADRYDLRKMYILFHAISLPLLWSIGSLAGLPLLICAIGYAFFAFGMQPIENSLVAVLTPARLRSTAYGLKFILTFGVGALAVQFVGSWQERGGLAAVFRHLSLFLLLLLVFATLLWYVTRSEDLQTRVRRRIARGSGEAALEADKDSIHD